MHSSGGSEGRVRGEEKETDYSRYFLKWLCFVDVGKMNQLQLAMHGLEDSLFYCKNKMQLLFKIQL